MKGALVFCALLIVCVSASEDVGNLGGPEAIVNLTICTRQTIRHMSQYGQWLIRDFTKIVNGTRTKQLADIDNNYINPLSQDVESLVHENPDDECLASAMLKLRYPSVNANRELAECMDSTLSNLKTTIEDNYGKNASLYVEEGLKIAQRLDYILANCNRQSDLDYQRCTESEIPGARTIVTDFNTRYLQMRNDGESHRRNALEDIHNCNEAAMKIVHEQVTDIRKFAMACIEGPKNPTILTAVKSNRH